MAKVEAQTEKQAAGATAADSTLLEYAWHEKRRGLSEATIKPRIYRLRRLMERGADLNNPDSVLSVLASEELSPTNKKLYVAAYKAYAKFRRLEWEPPRIQVAEKLPFIPHEEELDQLIAGCGRKTATFLQLLKETGARASEAARIKWIDIDTEALTIRINNPMKGSAGRVLKVSPKLIAMLNALPKTGEYVFNPKVHTIQENFQKQRNRIARKLQNPRISQIRLHTFRHWKATMEYYKTKDILYVKYLLGHKQLKNTEIYTHLIGFNKEEYHVACARNLEEEKKLLEAGFEYVRYSEKDGMAIYRKRK